MAPLPFTFNPFAVGARAALDEGKREAAKQLMLEHLRLTNHPVYEIAAELLSKKSKQGAAQDITERLDRDRQRFFAIDRAYQKTTWL